VLQVLKVADVQADLLTPAVEGTLNVLRAAKKGQVLPSLVHRNR
jgi:hypothetical protein